MRKERCEWEWKKNSPLFFFLFLQSCAKRSFSGFHCNDIRATELSNLFIKILNIPSLLSHRAPSLFPLKCLPFLPVMPPSLAWNEGIWGGFFDIQASLDLWGLTMGLWVSTAPPKDGWLSVSFFQTVYMFSQLAKLLHLLLALFTSCISVCLCLCVCVCVWKAKTNTRVMRRMFRGKIIVIICTMLADSNPTPLNLLPTDWVPNTTLPPPPFSLPSPPHLRSFDIYIFSPLFSHFHSNTKKKAIKAISQCVIDTSKKKSS